MCKEKKTIDCTYLFNMTKRMREAQREYFRTRSKSALDRAKQLETMVDHELAQVEDLLKQEPTQLSLFE